MPLLDNIGLLASCLPAGPQSELHAIRDAALVWEGDVISWVGAEADLPPEYHRESRQEAGGRLVVPGLVDCHTHLGFGGWRAEEFEQRIRGRSYQQIAAAGGGIAATMARTRELDSKELAARCRGFLAEMAALGVTTVECKSGYGLDRDHELRLLEVYATLAREGPQRIVSTLLAAHVLPPEYRSRRQDFVKLIVDEIIPAVAARGLATFCDVFVEEAAFTVEEARTILRAGLAHGLRPKLHADQLSAGGGAELAVEVGAVSADHLEHTSEAGARAMARSGVVAVSLPLAALYLGQEPMPARRFLEAGVATAVATDFNPGSAPSYHLPLALTLACIRQRMTPAEALKGATIIAARAIGLEDRVGSLEAGKAADFAVIDAPDVNHWLYHFRPNACLRTVIGGTDVWRASP
ncbi:MAG TPA: imidazolonepropionase [Gemmatimonadales bacterium]